MEHRPPAPSDPDETGYQIDDLILDVGQQRVTRAGVDIPLPHLSFALLLTLARAAPNLVTFEQLSAQVWPRLVITPETISQRVKLVRSALGDDPQAPHYITGVRGRGYRMIASVQPLAARQPLPARSAAPPQESSGPAPAPPVPAGAAAAGVPPPAAMDGVAGATLPPLRSPLTWITGVAAVLVLLALPWGVTRYLRSPAPVAADARTVTVQPPRTIAVLPLVDVTPGDGNAYLGDGLAQELSARLGRISGLRVASSTSAYSFRDRDKDVRTIAQTLGVRHVLEGSVMREGNQLRVTAQLIDAASGYNVWSQTYNRTWQDLVAIQDDLARSIIGTLRLVLSNELAQRSAQPPTTQVDAFDAYLAGLAMLRGHAGHAELEQAEDNFRRALALDPRFALAYAGLCERFAAGYDATRDAQLVAKAEEACGQALKLDHSLREVSLALAHLYLVSGRNEQAAALYRELIRADPENADGYIGLGEALEGGQHHDDAERAFRQAVEAEPTYWYAQTAAWQLFLPPGALGRGGADLPARHGARAGERPRAEQPRRRLHHDGGFPRGGGGLRALARHRALAQRLFKPRHRVLLPRPLPERGAHVHARHRAGRAGPPRLGQPGRRAVADQRQPRRGARRLPPRHRPRAAQPCDQRQRCSLVDAACLLQRARR